MRACCTSPVCITLQRRNVAGQSCSVFGTAAEVVTVQNRHLCRGKGGDNGVMFFMCVCVCVTPSLES